MAAPIALAGLGATIFGGILGAQGATQAGDAALQQNYYQAGIAQYNAAIAKQNADYALNVGEQQAQTYGLAEGERIGQIIASQASSGLDVNTGSAAAVQAGQKMVGGLDVTQIRANAAKAAYDYDTQSTQFTQQAGLYEMAGTNAVQAAKINAESSILGTVGSVATKWTQGQQVGLFSDIGSTVSNAASSVGSTLSGFNPFAGI